MPTLLALEESLERVRGGLEKRARRLGGRVGLELASYVGRPGKMLRARYCLLLGAALGVEPENSEAAARAMELVHNASLLHDDCVDEATLRRGQPTPNKIFGTTVALLLGDLAFSQGLEEAIDISPNAANHLVTTVREMTIGELQEEFLRGRVDLTLDAYLGVAARKTGALFEWCGNVLSELSPHEHSRSDPARLSCAAGILLQIVDDIHDFIKERGVTGKERAKDFSAGRLTLPGIFALQDPAARGRFLELWRPGGLASAEGGQSPPELALLLETSGALEKARAQGRELVRSMLALARELPCPAEARELALFIEVMASREF